MQIPYTKSIHDYTHIYTVNASKPHELENDPELPTGIKGSEPYELENDPELPDSMTIASLLRL